MKALQIIQTVMLLGMLAIGGWIGSTTVESARAISRMEEQVKSMSYEQGRLGSELTRLWESQSQIEHRVTVIEGKLSK